MDNSLKVVSKPSQNNNANQLVDSTLGKEQTKTKDKKRRSETSLKSKLLDITNSLSLSSGEEYLAPPAKKISKSHLESKIKKLSSELSDSEHFLRDILYTLNCRGYESIRSSKGVLIPLGRCNGDCLLELKGRDPRLKNQISSVKRTQLQENALRALIGSQEKTIQALSNRLSNYERAQLVGSRLNSGRTEKGNNSESSARASDRVAILENELLSLVDSLEFLIERLPNVFIYLREYLRNDKYRSNCRGTSGILEALLDRIEQGRILDDSITSSSSAFMENRISREREAEIREMERSKTLLTRRYSNQQRNLANIASSASQVEQQLNISSPSNHYFPELKKKSSTHQLLRKDKASIIGSNEDESSSRGKKHRSKTRLNFPMLNSGVAQQQRPLTSVNEYNSNSGQKNGVVRKVRPPTASNFLHLSRSHSSSNNSNWYN